VDEFRGLAHVVEVFRNARDHWDRICEADVDLFDVLRKADRYMSEIDPEPAVNESALPPGMGEKRCGSTHAHVAHRWSSGPIDTFWCVGRRMSALQ